MTVVGLDKYSEDMDVRRRYRYSACPRCKAETEEQAGNVCYSLEEELRVVRHTVSIQGTQLAQLMRLAPKPGVRS